MSAVVPANPPVAAGAKGPMYVRSILIPRRHLNEADLADVRNTLANHLTKLMIRGGYVSDASQVTVRDALPATDFTLGTETWVTGAIPATTWTNYVNAALGNARYAAFYGIWNNTANPQIVAVRFSLGVGGSPFQTVHTQKLGAEQVPAGLLADPVVYSPNDTVTVQVYARGAVVTEDLGFYCMIAERLGVVASGQQLPG